MENSSFEELCKRIDELINVDKYGAIDEAKRILNTYSLSTEQKGSLYFCIAGRYHELKLFPKAISYYKKVLQLTEADSEKKTTCLILIGSAYLNLYKYRKVIQISKKIEKSLIEDIKLRIEFIWIKGSSLEKIRRYEEALKLHNELISIFNQHPDLLPHPYLMYALYSRAHCLERLGRGEEAVAQIQAILKNTEAGSNEFYNAHLSLGHVHYGHKNWKEAIQHYEIVLNSENSPEEIRKNCLPYLPYSYGWLGNGEFQNQTYAIAADYYQKALHFIKDGRKEKRYKRAIEECQRLLKKSSR